jgi:hypothetical protein
MSTARTTAIRNWAGRTRESAERLASTWHGGLVLIVSALTLYALESIGWPLSAGRDLGVYLRYFADIGESPPVYPWEMLSRTPVTPIVAGGLLAGGSLLAQVVMALLYAFSVLAWAAAARAAAGPRAAVAVVAALLLFPGYAGLFHELSSDSLFAAAYSGWAYALTRAFERRALAWFAIAGAGVAMLALTRPANQALVLLAPLVLLVSGKWWLRVTRMVVFAGVAVGFLAAWAGYNDVRYGDFTVARGGQASIPLFRAFVTDRIMSPDNGPASRRLAAAVRDHLLPLQPYRGYGITLHRFFTSGSLRMQEDLIGLSDRVFGWETNYSVLGQAAREAVLRHPWKYTRGVATSFWQELSDPLFVPPQPGVSAPSSTQPPPGNGPGITSGTVVVAGQQLPKPSDGEPIPAAHLGANESTPDGHIREVWRSPIDHGTVFADPRDAVRAAQVTHRFGELLTRLPKRRENGWLYLQQNRSSKLYPPAWTWLIVGLGALLVRRPRGWRAPVVLTVAGLTVTLVTILGVYAIPEYSVPVIPSFVLLTAVGLLAPRALERESVREAGQPGTLRPESIAERWD